MHEPTEPEKLPRHFDNWLKIYCDWARDNYCPDKFHVWSGISALACALGRSLWAPVGNGVRIFPNLFILLVAKPGIGKSSAMKKAKGFLDILHDECRLNVLPAQTTEAKLIDLMGKKTKAVYEPDGSIVYDSSSVFYASEASNSLKAIYGEFVSTITDFYDCPDLWSKGTMKDGEKKYQNICLNMIAGSTPNFLNKLITGDNIEGGFASRNIYVIQNQLIHRKSQWGNKAESQDAKAIEKLLAEDLLAISQLRGPVLPTSECLSAYEKWRDEVDMQVQTHPSPTMCALLSRKATAVTKLMMILSVSARQDRVVELKHFEEAVALYETTEKDLPQMIGNTQSMDTNPTRAINQMILNLFRQNNTDRIHKKEFRRLSITNFPHYQITRAINDMNQTGVLQVDPDDHNFLILVHDPDIYL